MRSARLALLTVLLSMLAHGGEQAKWKHLTTDDGLPGNDVQFLQQRPDGTIWIGTLSGLGVCRGEKHEILVKKRKVWDVLPTAEGRYWVGTGTGVLLLGGKQDEPALKQYTVAPLIPVADGKAWAIAKEPAGQGSMVVAFDGEKWAPVEALQGEDVEDMFRTRDGDVWITVEGNGILQVSPGTPAKAVRHLAGRNVTAFQQDGKGRVWCGTWGSGIYMLSDSQWTRHLAQERAAILDIDEDSGGRIWVATNANGLWRQHGNGWANDLKAEGSVNLMEPTSDGRIWISNQAKGGLRYWDGKGWHTALPGPLPMRCILETEGGDLWVGGVMDGVHIMSAQ